MSRQGPSKYVLAWIKIRKKKSLKLCTVSRLLYTLSGGSKLKEKPYIYQWYAGFFFTNFSLQTIKITPKIYKTSKKVHSLNIASLKRLTDKISSLDWVIHDGVWGLHLLNFVTSCFRFKAVAKLLIKSGADVNIRDKNSCTAFDMASVMGG